MSANNSMVFCAKLKKQAPALASSPYPGDIGKRILQDISAEAWQLWLEQQTMLINEYRLNVLDKSSRTFIEQSMQDFLFSDDDQKPSGYNPPNK